MEHWEGRRSGILRGEDMNPSSPVAPGGGAPYRPEEGESGREGKITMYNEKHLFFLCEFLFTCGYTGHAL